MGPHPSDPGSPTGCSPPRPRDGARPTCRSSGCRRPASAPHPSTRRPWAPTSCCAWRASSSPTTWSRSAPILCAPPGRGRGAAGSAWWATRSWPPACASTCARLGRPEGGPRPHVVALGAPLDELLAHTWTQRCFEHGSKPWAEWLRFWRERDQLPARVDLADSVGRWHPRRPLGPGRHRPRPAGPRGSAYGPCRRLSARVPGADQAELARRVAAVVGLRVPAAERPALMRTLQRRIPDSGVAPVGVPDRERDWVASSAARMTRHLTRAGYPVVGDLADLAPRSAAPPR